MRVHLTSAARARKAAATLRAALAGLGHHLTISRSQEATADILGFGDWRELRASKAKPSPLDHELDGPTAAERHAFQAARLATFLGIPVAAARRVIETSKPSGDISRDRIRPGSPGAANPWLDALQDPYRGMLDATGCFPGIPDGAPSEMIIAIVTAIEHETSLALLRARKTGRAEDYRGAAALLHAGSAQGSPGAMYNLANLLAQGKGIDRDEESAVQLFERAIETLGSVKSMVLPEHATLRGQAWVNLGNIYQYGIQVARDLPRALSLYREGMRDGDLVAGYNVALMNLCRWGCNKTDFQEVFASLRMSAEGGCEPARPLLWRLAEAVGRGPKHLLFVACDIASGSEDWARAVVVKFRLKPGSAFYDPSEGKVLARCCLPDGMMKSARKAATLLVQYGDAEGKTIAHDIFEELSRRGDLDAC